MIQQIPLYYKPITILLTDDDEALAQSIVLKFHQYRFKIFHDPTQTLSYFESGAAQAEQPEIGIILTDFHMPQLTGLQMLSRLKSRSKRRILMTSEQDYSIATCAFNDNLIHAYLRKDHPQFLAHMSKALEIQQWEYFAHKTAASAAKLEPYAPFFETPACAEWFYQLTKQGAISAFEWNNTLGGFELQNNKGQKSYVLVRHQTQLAELAHAAQEDGASKHTVTHIQNAQALPFFGPDQAFWNVKASEWEPLLKPVTALIDGWVLVGC